MAENIRRPKGRPSGGSHADRPVPARSVRRTRGLESRWWVNEEPIRLSVVPRCIPAAADGRRVSIASVYRWTLAGLNGVVLRRFRIGGAYCTTRQELDRWSAALTALANGS